MELPAALSAQKHEDDNEISGDGQAAFKELNDNYNKVTDEVIRATMEELVNTPMEPGHNSGDYFNQKHFLRHKAEKMGEIISDRYFNDICVTGFTDEYKDVKMIMYRDPSFNVDQMQTTRHVFLDEQSRKGPKEALQARDSPWPPAHQQPASNAERADTSAGTAPKGEAKGENRSPNQQEPPSGVRSTSRPKTPTKNAMSKERIGRRNPATRARP